MKTYHVILTYSLNIHATSDHEAAMIGDIIMSDAGIAPSGIDVFPVNFASHDASVTTAEEIAYSTLGYDEVE